VASVVPVGLKKQALLHDAAEAYIGDVVQPVKCDLKTFNEIETRVYKAVAARFGLPEELDNDVLRADMQMLSTEAHQLMYPFADDWHLREKPLKFTIPEWSLERAEKEFLWAARDLGIV